MEISIEISAVLARAEDAVVGDAVAALDQRDQAYRRTHVPAEHRRDVQHLFGLVRRCLHEGRADPVVTPSQQFAADRFVAGVDLADVQATFAVLEEMLWRHLAAELPGDRQLEMFRLVNAILGTGKDALARTYVALARNAGGPLPEPGASGRWRQDAQDAPERDERAGGRRRSGRRCMARWASSRLTTSGNATPSAPGWLTALSPHSGTCGPRARVPS